MRRPAQPSREVLAILERAAAEQPTEDDVEAWPSPWAKLRPEYEGFMERLTWRADHYATREQRAAFQRAQGFDALALRERAQRLTFARRDLSYAEVTVMLDFLSMEWLAEQKRRKVLFGRDIECAVKPAERGTRWRDDGSGYQ